jgi:hypothetical protein
MTMRVAPGVPEIAAWGRELQRSGPVRARRQVQDGARGRSRFDGALQRLALILRAVRPDAEGSGIDPAARHEFARQGWLVRARRRCGGARGGPSERGK